MHRFPTIRVIMVLAKKEARWVEQLRQRNIMAIIPRTAKPERFSAVLDSVSQWNGLLSRRVGQKAARRHRRYWH